VREAAVAARKHGQLVCIEQPRPPIDHLPVAGAALDAAAAAPLPLLLGVLGQGAREPASMGGALVGKLKDRPAACAALGAPLFLGVAVLGGGVARARGAQARCGWVGCCRSC
jgi:hypothetical protein